MIVAVLAGSLAGFISSGQLASQASAATVTATADGSGGFTDDFFPEDCHFSATGSNRFFILEPGYKSVF